MSAIFEYQSMHNGHERCWLGQRGEIFLIYTLTIVDSAGSTINTAKIRKELEMEHCVSYVN